VGTFGLVTREKRIERSYTRWRRVAAARPGVRLLSWGRSRTARAWRRACRPRVSWPPPSSRPRPLRPSRRHMELADAVAHLRYPTARADSARCCASQPRAGRPWISTSSTCRRGRERGECAAERERRGGRGTRALLRLAAAPSLRARLGAARACVRGPRARSALASSAVLRGHRAARSTPRTAGRGRAGPRTGLRSRRGSTLRNTSISMPFTPVTERLSTCSWTRRTGSLHAPKRFVSELNAVRSTVLASPAIATAGSDLFRYFTGCHHRP